MESFSLFFQASGKPEVHIMMQVLRFLVSREVLRSGGVGCWVIVRCCADCDSTGTNARLWGVGEAS